MAPHPPEMYVGMPASEYASYVCTCPKKSTSTPPSAARVRNVCASRGLFHCAPRMPSVSTAGMWLNTTCTPPAPSASQPSSASQMRASRCPSAESSDVRRTPRCTKE